MSKNTIFIAFILLITNLLSCKNEPQSVQAPTVENGQSTSPNASNINLITKEKITLKDGSEIVFPKEDDKSSIVFYFTTPAQSKDTLTSLSDKGQAQANQLTSVMAKAGLTIVYIDGNAAMQTALVTARASYAELNVFKGEKADETLKLLAHNYMGKKVMVCAAAPVITEMITKLTGKPAPDVHTSPNYNLYVVIAKALGDGELKMFTY